MKAGSTSVDIFGVRVDNVGSNEVKSTLGGWLSGTASNIVYTPNPEILLHARSNREYAKMLDKADLNIPDGFGIRLVSGISHTVHGSDTAKWLALEADRRRLTLLCVVRKDGLSTPQQVQQAVQRIAPNTHIQTIAVDIHSNESVALQVTQDPAVVLVGLGFPHQERWVQEHANLFPAAKILMAVGGTFDFWTGAARRAPGWMRTLKIEWLWRVVQRPSRIGRILNATLVFPITALWETLSNR